MMHKEELKIKRKVAHGEYGMTQAMIEVEQYSNMMTRRKDAIKNLLSTIPGEFPDREGLLDTPDRVARMYEEIFAGYEQDPSEILNKTFAIDEEETHDVYGNPIVVVKEIPFYSHCEHHMVPFIGHAWVAYIPKDRVVGLSKIARLVECYAKRLQIQERMTNQIAEALAKYLDPHGVMVVLKAEHLCMSMRGVKKPGSKTVTSAITGLFKENQVRAEALKLFEM